MPTTTANQLKKNGIDIEIVWIGTKLVHGCIACGKYQGNCCNFNDDITNRIIEKKEERDGLVMGSLVYYGQPAGQLLYFLRKMMYAGSSVFVLAGSID